MPVLPTSSNLRASLQEMRARKESLKQQRQTALRSSDRAYALELADEISLLEDGEEKLEQFIKDISALENRFGAFCALYHWRV